LLFFVISLSTVTQQSAEEKAKELQCQYLETSSKTGEGVDVCFLFSACTFCFHLPSNVVGFCYLGSVPPALLGTR
jgi:hypothetical protein